MKIQVPKIHRYPRTIAVILLPLLLAGLTFYVLRGGEGFSAPAAPQAAVAENIAPAVSLPTEVKTVPGDINSDGVVNMADLAVVAGSYNTEGEGLKGDLNHDGRVNMADLVIVAAAYQ